MIRQIVNFRYTRLSNDPEGLRADHETQNRALDAVEAVHGLPAGRTYTDDDRSASKASVVRAGYQAMLADIAALDRSKFEPIVTAYALDRLVRQIGEVVELADLLDFARGRLITQAQGPMSVESGGRQALILTGAIGHVESETIGLRTRGGIDTAAMAGKPHARTPFGWRSEYEIGPGRKLIRTDFIDPKAQALVLDCARRVLKGDALREIARDLAAEGMPTPGAAMGVRTKGGALPIDQWTGSKVKALLVRPANAAIRVHRSARRGDETRYAATWPRLMDTDTYDRLIAVLTAPERKQAAHGGVRYLLSGLLMCGVCNLKLRGQAERGRKGGRGVHAATYRCDVGHVTRDMRRTETVVVNAVLATLKSDAVRSALLAGEDDETGAARDAREAAVARQLTLEADYEGGEISREQFLRLNRSCREQIASADAVLGRRRDVPVYDDLLKVSPDAVELAWWDTPFSRQRAIIGALFDVRVVKVARTPRFDPGSIKITLKGMEHADAA